MARATQESPRESKGFLSLSMSGRKREKERSRDVGSITARHFFALDKPSLETFASSLCPRDRSSGFSGDA